MLLKSDILIIEDEDDIRSLITGILTDEGYQVRTASNGLAGLRLLHERKPSLIILDIWLGQTERDGIEILKEIKESHPFLPVIMISGHATIEKAVLALKLGALDFLEKPFQMDKLLLIIERTHETILLKKHAQELFKNDLSEAVIAGQSPYAQDLRKQLEQLYESDSHVLILGPKGSGQEYIAKIIHNNSPRRANFFSTINTTTYNEMFLEKELFGLEVSGRKDLLHIGILEQAHLGSLCLNQISKAPDITQKKFIDFMLCKSFKRNGGKNSVSPNVRLFFLENFSLKNLKDNDTIRKDFFSIPGITIIETKSLKERASDLESIIEFLLENRCRFLDFPKKKMDKNVINLFTNYAWEGNFYQIKLLIEWTIINSHDEHLITLNHVPKEFQNEEAQSKSVFAGLPIKQAREEFEKNYLNYHLGLFNGNVNQLAQYVGMERTALYRKLKGLSKTNATET